MSLATAAQRLGGKLEIGQRTWRWYGRWMNDYNAADAAHVQGLPPSEYGKGEHALSFPARLTDLNYEVGICRVGDKLKPVWDFIDHKLTQTLGGQKAPLLVMRYVAEVTRKQCVKLGYAIEEKASNDRLELVCTSYSDNHQILITVDGEGKVTCKAEGFQGPSCSMATAPFVRALGEAVGTVDTPEMWESPSITEVKERLQ